MTNLSKKKATKLVNKWNETHRVGCGVNVTLDDGEVKPTITTSEAWLLGGHTPVILVEGISGCYDLSRVRRDQFRS